MLYSAARGLVHAPDNDFVVIPCDTIEIQFENNGTRNHAPNGWGDSVVLVCSILLMQMPTLDNLRGIPLVENLTANMFPTAHLNSIGAPKRGAHIPQPSAARILCFLIACSPLAFIVVRATAGLLISSWEPRVIRPPNKRLGWIRKIGSN